MTGSGSEGSRTPGLPIANRTLSHLSYRPVGGLRTETTRRLRPGRIPRQRGITDSQPSRQRDRRVQPSCPRSDRGEGLCRELDLNQWPPAFQTSALPTELSRRAKRDLEREGAAPMGFEPTISYVTGRRPLRAGPQGQSSLDVSRPFRSDAWQGCFRGHLPGALPHCFQIYTSWGNRTQPRAGFGGLPVPMHPTYTRTRTERWRVEAIERVISPDPSRSPWRSTATTLRASLRPPL